MKVPVLSSIALLLGCASPLLAIERPKSLDEAPKEKGDQIVDVEAAEVDTAPIAPMPWLGVFGEEPTETLRQHLSLEGGVVLRYVADDSPASAAGLNAHDIVLELDGKKLTSQEDLRLAVAEHKPGDKIAMSVISKGERVQREVQLGERPPMLGAPMPHERFGLGGNLDLNDLPNLRGLRGLDRVFPNGLLDDGAQARLEEKLREFDEKLKHLENLPGMELDIEDMLKGLPQNENGFNMSLKASSSVTLMDEEGSVEMKVNDGSKEVVVRDLEGKMVYEGPWDNEQDYAAVTPEVRERIEKLNFDKNGGGLKLHFGAPEPKDIPQPEKAE